YINVYIATNYMATRIAHVLLYKVRPGTPAKRHRVVMDYSSPNIAKEMHIGHLRSTIIGDTIAKILEFAGHDVLRVNHVGDWGTQFGMLIAHLKDMQARGESISVDMGGLTAFYKAAKVRFDTEPEFKERAHKEVVALQAGDATNLELWRSMVKLSQATYDEVYQRLQVDPRLELCGESFYNDKIAPIIAELEGSGRAVISEGALIVPVPGSEVPLMLRKSDGGFGYDSTDLAAIRYRLHTLKADVLVYVVDAGQSLHFELVFKGAQQAGWYNPAETRVVHTGFGVIQGDDRKKFKTRSGDTVRLVDVLDEAKARALKQIRDREAAKEEGERATEETMQNTASVLGYGGVKYFDLRQHRNTDYVFNYDRMLSADGDTAVYLEYAHVRLCSILRKAAGMGLDVDAIKNRIETEGLAFQHTTEVALVTKLLCFQDVIAAVERDLTPHYLCEYLYHVANLAAEFTRDCNVLGATTPAPVRDSRLRIVAATVDTLAQGLRLLGITPLDRI
ncbi:arginine--tRNA ligase, partial [archaeon]